MSKTELFVRQQPGGMMVVNNEAVTTGEIFWVDSGSGTGGDGTGFGKNPDAPFKTIDYAIGNCTANNGDIIYVMPGHAETITSAGAITCDVAGVSIIGIGEGADRPTITFTSTDNSATFLLTAASVKIKNIVGVCGDDGLTSAFVVSAADCELDITWRDPEDVEAATCILTTADASRLKIKLKYEGDTGGNACVAPITLIGVTNADITVDFYGKASTAVIDMKTTACSGIEARGYFYNSTTTDFSKNMKATIGGGTWFISGYDGAAGASFSGGSGATVAGDDVSGVVSQCTSIATGMVSVGAQFAAVASQATSIATGTVSVGAQVLSGATSIGTGTSVINSQAISIATGTVSVGAQVLSGATSIGTGTSVINSQAISIATGTVSVGAQVLSGATSIGTGTSVINSQAISIATGTVSVGAQVLSGATSIGTGTSVINSQAISVATGVVSIGTQVVSVMTAAGTEFTISKIIEDKTTIETGGLVLTGVSSGGELILKRVTLQNDATVTGGNTGGALIYSNDADNPLNVSLTNAVFAASGFLGLDVGYPLQVGKVIGIKAVTGNCTGAGSLIITMTFVRNANAATIAAV